MSRKHDSIGKRREYRDGQRERSKQYYCAHREEVKKKRDEYYQANKEMKRQYSQLHYNANRERVKEKRSEHYKAHKEAMKQKSARYYREHRDLRRKYALGYYETHKNQKAQYYLRNRERLLQYQRDYARAREKMEKEGHVEQRSNGGRDFRRRSCRQRAVVVEQDVLGRGNDGFSQEGEKRESPAEGTARSSEDKSNADIPAEQGGRQKKDEGKRRDNKYNSEPMEKEVDLARACMDSLKEAVAGARLLVIDEMSMTNPEQLYVMDRRIRSAALLE